MTTPPELPPVRFIVVPEPGDRPALVGLLAQILMDQRRGDRERAVESAAGEPEAAGPEGSP